MGNKPEVVRNTLMNCQICVPKDWTDEQADEFANLKNPSGTRNGWILRKGTKKDPERVPCDDREGFVHIMFEC